MAAAAKDSTCTCSYWYKFCGATPSTMLSQHAIETRQTFGSKQQAVQAQLCCCALVHQIFILPTGILRKCLQQLLPCSACKAAKPGMNLPESGRVIHTLADPCLHNHDITLDHLSNSKQLSGQICKYIWDSTPQSPY